MEKQYQEEILETLRVKSRAMYKDRPVDFITDLNDKFNKKRYRK